MVTKSGVMNVTEKNRRNEKLWDLSSGLNLGVERTALHAWALKSSDVLWIEGIYKWHSFHKFSLSYNQSSKQIFVIKNSALFELIAGWSQLDSKFSAWQLSGIQISMREGVGGGCCSTMKRECGQGEEFCRRYIRLYLEGERE